MPVTMFKFINDGLPLHNIVERLPPGDICNINIKENDIVLFCYGWNDVQKNIFKYGKNNHREIINQLVVKYIECIKMYKIKPIINCIYPVPLSINDTIFGSDDERIEYTIFMNARLKEECSKNNIPFFDIYELLNDNGKMKSNLLEKDGTHLNLQDDELRDVIEEKLFKIIENAYK